MIDTARRRTALKAETMVDVAEGSPLRLLDDQPEPDGTSLWQGLSTFAVGVGQVLSSLPDDSPILITGSWGAGKTTFLRALQQQIDADHLAKRRTVWFEA